VFPEILICHIFKMFNVFSYSEEHLFSQVFEDVMKTYEEAKDYNPSEWEKYSVFYTTYFTYQWGIVACDRLIKTKAAKELLEMIKTVEFDVIVHDITLDECLYGLWEVKIKQSLFSKI